MLKDNDIIITSQTSKISLLKENKTLKNFKIYSLNEFNKLYFIDYDIKTISYVMEKYNVIYEIAKIYLDNLIYIEDQEYKNSKLKFLFDLKQDLLKNKMLKEHNLFRKSLKNKKICFYNLPQNKELLHLKSLLDNDNKVNFYDDYYDENIQHEIYELNNIEQEVEFVANKICDLINEGINIEKIFIANLNDEYRKEIRKIFPMFNIPVTLENDNSIYGTYLVTKFLELYENNISITIDKLKNYVDSEESEEIFTKIINIINKYVLLNDFEKALPLIKYDLKNTYKDKIEINNSVNEVSFKDKTFKDDDYVFLLAFNQGVIPVVYKDEEFLTDEDKKEIFMSLTVDKNKYEKEIIKNKIKNTKNLFITYKLHSKTEDFYLSNINEELSYKVIKNNTISKEYSNLYNKIKLTSLKDQYFKYGTTSDDLYILDAHYPNLPYNIYSNEFTNINKNDLHEFLKNNLKLSYSSLDRYFNCPFSYYIGNILKLNIYEETFFQIIGNIFHSILEKFNKSNLSYDELWENELKSLDYAFNNKEKFFLKKLKKELYFIIETIKNQDNYTDLKDELHEEKIYTSISGEIKITFSGIIDKIKYKKDNDKIIVAIIDYKTGTPNLDLTTIPYGIGMQLPIYLYLAKNSPKLKNIKIAGFYLQKILNNEMNVDNCLSYEQQKRKNLLLQGYSNENMEILSVFDKTFEDSKLIKSMKVTKNNSFYSYSKVLSEKNMDKIEKIATEKIKEGAQAIINADFKIAPKQIGLINKSCALCKFKDICFHTSKDIVELPVLKIDDILGDE